MMVLVWGDHFTCFAWLMRSVGVDEDEDRGNSEVHLLL